MKKNSVFPVMIGLSLTLHGFVFFGWVGSNPSAPVSGPESQPVVRTRLIRMAKATPQSVSIPVPVPVQQQEQKVVEKKPVELPPEPVPQQEAGIIGEAHEGDEAHNGDEGMAQGTDGGENGIITGSEYGETGGSRENREYEELLAYISSLIKQNLLYPQMARRRNIEGVVGVRFEIAIDGSLVFVRVNHSSGSSILDKAAVSLIEKICPIKSDEIRKDMALNINITYELTE
jgi:protein TonB